MRRGKRTIWNEAKRWHGTFNGIINRPPAAEGVETN
jgi:hypothetical protein